MVDWLPYISTGIAFLAYRNTVKSGSATSNLARDISEDHKNLNAYFALRLATEKYVPQISSINKDFKKIVKELSESAYGTLNKIEESIDKYDTSEKRHPYLRHCYHRMIEEVRRAYDKDLAYQHSAYVMPNLRGLKLIRFDVDAPELKGFKPSFFFSRWRKTEPLTPSQVLDLSTSFWGNAEQIYTRVPREKEHEFFSETLALLKEYRDLHAQHSDKLKELSCQLAEIICENEVEMFQITEVPVLGQKFRKLQRDIEYYRNFGFQDFSGLESAQIHDGIAFSVYAGSVLFILSQNFMWGKL